jgi:hypothetical protein
MWVREFQELHLLEPQLAGKNCPQQPLACIIHESRVKNPETTTRYKLQRLDLNNSLFCLSVTGLSGEKIMVKKAEKRGQKTL